MYITINFVTKTSVLSNKNFYNNTTNFGPCCKSYPLNNFYYRPI